MNKIIVKNYEITYTKKEFNGEPYISGHIDYIGKTIRRCGNGFITGNIAKSNKYPEICIRFDFPELIPQYVMDKLISIYKKVLTDSK